MLARLLGAFRLCWNQILCVFIWFVSGYTERKGEGSFEYLVQFAEKVKIIKDISYI